MANPDRPPSTALRGLGRVPPHAIVWTGSVRLGWGPDPEVEGWGEEASRPAGH